MPAEQDARIDIDKLLTLAGWRVVDVQHANIHADRGVAIRELPLKSGHGFADYLLYVGGTACGVIDRRLKGVEYVEQTDVDGPRGRGRH